MPPAGHPSWLATLAAADHLPRLGWVVVHSLWQAAAVAIVLAVALRLVPRRSALGQEIRYGLAVLALFFLPVCAMIWLAGAIAAAMRLAVGWSLGRRLVATATEVPGAGWQARLDRRQSALGIAFPIRLVASARVDVPIVVGWLRPVVIWPLAATTGMPPEQIDAILAHELAHVRRHDVLVNLLQSAIEAVFFHHPAAWWISAQVRAEREHCADELAIRTLTAARAGSRISYATSLLSLEERRQMILAAAVNGGRLGDRIRRLVGPEEARRHPARLAAAILVLAAILTVEIAVVPNGRFAEAAFPATAAKPVADEALPQPPNRSESLTPEQARELMAALDPDEKNPLTIPAQTRLSADAAAVLAEYKGGLFLDLTTLDGDTAKALATFAGEQLWLNGLMTLSAEAAAALSQFQGQRLSLPCLSTLDASVA